MSKFRKAAAAAPCTVILSVILLASLLFFSGCSTYKKITGQGDKYNKKIAVTLFENKTFLDTGTFQKHFHRDLTASLQKTCSENIFLTPGDAGYPAFLSSPQLKPNGLVDNFALATSARKLGVNATVFGGIVSIKTNQRMKGYLWFKEARPMAKLNMAARAYDSETGAILFDETFEQEFEIDEAMLEEVQAKRLKDPQEFKAPFRRLVSAISEKICDEISSQPWKGYVVSVAGDKVILSSGKDSGILLGDILDVYDSGDTIGGMDGLKFYLPGAKSGEVKISGIFANRSEAVIVSGKNIRPGSTVKPK